MIVVTVCVKMATVATQELPVHAAHTRGSMNVCVGQVIMDMGWEIKAVNVSLINLMNGNKIM